MPQTAADLSPATCRRPARPAGPLGRPPGHRGPL